MNVLYISGSPRKDSNTDYLLNLTLSITGGQFIKLTNYHILPCNACWACRELESCVINDDLSKNIIPLLLKSDAIVLGSPVYFNNVSTQLKAVIDRTWAIRGQLRNKIGGAIVVGRRYGAEGAINAMNSFFLKHEMIPANRGVCGIAFAKAEIKQDTESIAAAKKLGRRILELLTIFKSKNDIA
ncbi:MAG: flavodoxin family protein [Candidatus Helarchaeota archaeon]